MEIRADDGKASLRLAVANREGNLLVLACEFESDFASARLAEVPVDRERARVFAANLARPGRDPIVLQSHRPGELVLAIMPIADSERFLVKATLTRLREIGTTRASDMLTLSFAIAAGALRALADAARELDANA